MGLFPENNLPKSDNAKGIPSIGDVLSRFPPGSDEAKAADRIIDFLKSGHAILKALIKEKRDGASREGFADAEEALKQSIRDMGVSNEIDVMALSSVIGAYAVMVPPSAYGDDYNEW